MNATDELNILRVKVKAQAYELERLRAELNAMDERETCRNVSDASSTFECSKCGGVYHTTAPQFFVPSYCPLCGRRVVE